MNALVRVVTSSESAARDAAAIAAGIPSRALMQRAGAAAASELALRLGDRLTGGVLVLAGPGNNGGDAWVVARALGAAGVRLRVVEPVDAKTPDARAERDLARAALPRDATTGLPTALADHGEAVVVDGLLGTGAEGAPRGAIADAITMIGTMRERGAFVAALDVPSGLDSSAGVRADLTLTFGTLKRSQLVQRGRCGPIVVLDIGLGPHAELGDHAPWCVDERWVAEQVPPIDAAAHKGARKKLAIVGGAPGMAGATMIAARAALRSGVGMVKLVVAPASMAPVQEGEPHALATTWPADDGAEITAWADALVLGPGLGNTRESRAMIERLLRRFDQRRPVLLDADALNVFANDAGSLGDLLGGRPAIITPHPAELARLVGTSTDEVLHDRFEIGARVAETLGAVVLLKGVPTIVSAPPADGRRLVSAAGNPVLATAGSGDLLCGIAGTLLAQTGDPLIAGAAAAWIHGRAAELASSTTRGATLDDVLTALRDSWRLRRDPSRYPVLAELPGVSDGP